MSSKWDNIARLRAERERRQVDPEAYDAALRAERLAQAREDPAQPGLWGLYCLTIPEEERHVWVYPVPPKDPVKPAILDPMTLGNSGLTPETLWAGPPPEWPEDPDLGNPEEETGRPESGE